MPIDGVARQSAGAGAPVEIGEGHVRVEPDVGDVAAVRRVQAPLVPVREYAGTVPSGSAK